MHEVKHIKKNYILGIINGFLMTASDSIIGPRTVLPLFMSTITSSSVLIGLACSMHDALWPMPQIFMAHFLEGKPYKKFMYTYTAFIRSGAIFMISILIFTNPPGILPLFLLLLFIYQFAGGFAGLSFMDIVGKTVSSAKQPSFWGLRMAIGGVLSVAGGFYVKWVLGDAPVNTNFGILYLTASFMVAVALISFCFSYEPRDEAQKRTERFSDFLKDGLKLLSADSNFKILFITRVLLGISFGMNPFYVIFAMRVLGLSVSDVGIMIAVQMTGMIISNYIWNRVAKKYGMRSILSITSFLAVAIPLLAFSCTILGSFPLYAMFFLIGCTVSGISVGSPSILLSIAPGVKRPTYIGFMNTFLAPVFFYPTLNGIIIDAFSYYPAFIISIITGIAAFIVLSELRMEKPLS